jgi:hypothetical protein
MKKILIALCIAAFGMNLYSAGAKPQKLVIGNDPVRAEINRQGYIAYNLNGRTMFNLMLQVHWQHFAHQSKDLKIARQGENTLRSAGSFANIQFSSRTKLHSSRVETEYQLNLTEDNAFASSRHWEVTPAFTMKRLKEMENCIYSGICVNGDKFSGKIREIVSFPGRVRSFTVHNVQGYDLTLEFPDGADGLDRRKETKPAGLWFFVPAVTSDGAYPQKAGDSAVLRVNAEIRKSAEK